MMTEQTIPLNQLVHSKANVRQTGRTEGIGELAVSIAVHGLRQNLNVQPCEDGKHFEVVAGGRRLRAMKLLAKAGKLAKDAPVTCLVLGDGDDPAEISLAENAMRTAMHPDDQFEAFRALVEDKNMSVEDVGARFGVTTTVVRQRLKLANVSPKLRRLFRQGEMGLDHVMALAVSDDHAAQEKAWRELPDWNRDPSRLKDALTRDHLPMTDRFAKFVGVDTYVAAGGAVVRDLFDEENQGYLSDRALVMSLVKAKLEKAIGPVKAEGWKWVKPELTRDCSIQYCRIWPRSEVGSGEDGNEAGQATFALEDMADAGVFMRVAHDGTLQIDRGYIHPADAKTKRSGVTKAESGASAGFSASLVTDLTAHRTAALRIELSRQPIIALAMTVQALASSLLYRQQSACCLDLKANSADLLRHTKSRADSSAHQAMAEGGERWSSRLPTQADDLAAWCLGQPQEVLLDLLAFLAALSVDAVQMPRKDCRHEHADQLASALSLDMAQWWTPSVEGFYQRLPRAALLQAMAEAKVAADGPFAGIKKSEAAHMAAKALKDSGWLPHPLRLPA